jgi:uncharacterized protein
MNINLETPSTRLYFRHYEPGLITTNKEKYTSSIIMTSKDLVSSNWTPKSFDELTVDSFSDILKMDIEVVLLGTGSKQHIPSNDIFTAFFKHQKSVDFMSSHAACSTFNILADEGRAVLAAIIVE